MAVEVEVTHESPSGKEWEFTVSGRVCAPEPDVGIMYPWTEWEKVYWTKTGKELSPAAYNRLPDCVIDKFNDALDAAI